MTLRDPAGLAPLTDGDLTLETERLVLRPLSLNDTDMAVTMFTDPEVVRYVCDVSTPENITENMKKEVRRGAGGRIGIWCVMRKDTQEKIGSGVLLPMPVQEDDTNWSLVVPERYPDALIEVGYMLRPAAWGQGFATEICQRLLQFGFESTPLSEIVATTDPDNTASQHVLKKCGLRDEGMRRAYDCECSFFRLKRTDWQNG